MANNKVKIVGYAKKDFYNQGIEYRNFSPDLVGQQLTSDGGTSLFTSANFAITTNLDGKVNKNFVTKDFGDFTTLEDLKNGSEFYSEFYENSFKLKLNLDTTDVLNYAFFGSLREYIRVSLENIIITWPASLKITTYDAVDPSLTGSTVLNYVYNPTTNKSSFDVSTDRINNPFDINYLSSGSLLDTFNESNTLRNLTLNYANYVISNDYGKFKVIDFVGASASTTTTISFVVEGAPFPSFGAENIAYHIQPNDIKIEEFFTTLNDFENNLLNRSVVPIYTSKFTTYSEMDSGAIAETNIQLTWPTSDGYNIDFDTAGYELYVNQLISIAEANDDTKSNLMTRFLVSKSISEFDSVPTIDSIQQGTNGEKMNNALKIYGREFDEIKKYSDGISFANVVTYNKKNNTPDATLKNLARILGWDLTSSLSSTDIVDNYLTPNDSTYSGSSRGLTNTEAEIELWRRIILNTPWIWKSKGSRKAIEFIFKFIGVPDGLVTFNEHVYVAEETVDVDHAKFLMQYFNDTDDISTLNMDEDGYPRILPNTSDMYFQKAGLWYRTTGGDDPDIDLSMGNNPHIGPYDGGQAYIDQFTNCLVPNFEYTREVDERIEINQDNLFTNYNNGTFDECSGQTGLTESFGSSIEVTDIKGMDVSDCFNIITSITTIDGEAPSTGSTCDTVLEIKIGEPDTFDANCNYSGFTKQEDGLLLLTNYDGSTTLNVHPECCNALGYESEIGDDYYYVCRWGVYIDVNDCANYTPTGNFDANDYAIYQFVTGGTTTIVPKEECCFNNNLVGEATTGGFHCLELVVYDCGELVLIEPVPQFGDIQFYDPVTDTNVTVVEFSECCTLNGFAYRAARARAGYICYNNLEAILPTVTITNDACCSDEIVEDGPDPVEIPCEEWTLRTTTRIEQPIAVQYIDCDGVLQKAGDYIDVVFDRAIIFCAREIVSIDLGPNTPDITQVTKDNSYNTNRGDWGQLLYNGICGTPT